MEGRHRHPCASPVPPATIVRRRRAAVLTAAGAAFILGVSIGAGKERRDPASQPVRPGHPPPPSRRAHRRPTAPPTAPSRACRSRSKSASSSSCASTAPRSRRMCAASCATAGPRARSCSRPTSRPRHSSNTYALDQRGGQGRWRHADRLHRPGGRRDPQRGLGAAARAPRRASAPGQDARAAARALRRRDQRHARPGRRRADERRLRRSPRARSPATRRKRPAPRRRRSRAGAPAALPPPPSTSPVSAARR